MTANEIYQQYTWIVVLAGLFAFFTSFGIGANDVANAFATSVGSKALTIRKAMVIAGIFEFSGALLLGSSVSDTIRSGIADVNCFVDMPAVLMWGMCCVCLATGTWLLIATYLELPVSTTHSCVGGVVGFALVAVGSDCVTWSARSSEFPFVKGVSSIVLSWFFSPVLSALVSMAMYFSVRTFILRSPNSTERAFLFFPLLIAFTVMMCAFYITLKGTKKVNELWDFDAEGEDLWLTCVICIGSGLIAALFSLFLRPTIRRAIDDTPEEDELKHRPVPADAAITVPVSAVEKPPAPSKVGVLDWLRHTLDTETDMLVADSARVANMHAIAEKFPRKTEVVFKYMQIMTASFDSFAHGANDVANAVGPFAAVWYVYEQNGKFGKKNDVGTDMYWILAIGGFGIVVGLGVFGYKIMFALGVKLAKVTPSRGFAIELGSMFVVLLGSRFGIPLSTTHCQVGSTIGVSLLENNMASTNWTIVGRAILGWVFTMIVAGGLSAAVFALGYATIQFDDTQELTNGWQGF